MKHLNAESYVNCKLNGNIPANVNGSNNRRHSNSILLLPKLSSARPLIQKPRLGDSIQLSGECQLSEPGKATL